MLPARRRGRAIGCGVISTALIFLNFGSNGYNGEAQYLKRTKPPPIQKERSQCSTMSTQIARRGRRKISFPLSRSLIRPMFVDTGRRLAVPQGLRHGRRAFCAAVRSPVRSVA